MAGILEAGARQKSAETLGTLAPQLSLLYLSSTLSAGICLRRISKVVAEVQVVFPYQTYDGSHLCERTEGRSMVLVS